MYFVYIHRFIILLMLVDCKEKLTQSKLSQSSSIPKQSYAPFISKCSRFQPLNNKYSKEPRLKLDQRKQQSIHALSRSREKTQESKPPQYFFRSEKERFNDGKVMQTPSPVHYQIEVSQQNQESNVVKGPKKVLPIIKTIPAIPDSRNKYGYNFEDNHHTLVHKSSQQLQREKVLMKKYQQTLTHQKIREKQAKTSSCTHKQNDIDEKVKKILDKMPKIDKQNNTRHNFSTCQLVKPKFNHLYEYHPIRQQEVPINAHLSTTHSRKPQQTSIKYQFFNSSERRFKTIEAQSPPIKQKPSVRDYMSKLASKPQAL